MAQETYVVSALLMGLFVLVVAVAILRLRAWQHYSVRLPRHMATAAAEARAAQATGEPAADEFTFPGEDLADRLVHSQTMWYLGFVIAVLVFAAATLVSLSAEPSAALWTILLLFLVVFGLFLPVGLYVVLRNRGHASARAVGETVIVLGLMVVLAVVANLVGSG